MAKIRPSERSAVLMAILLLGLVVRLAPWGHNRFLEDEALYAFWGLQIASGADPMLDYEPVDKPPLHPYLLALSFKLFSPPLNGREGAQASLPSTGAHEKGRETAARLPSLFASVAGIALAYALGRALFGDAKTGLLAALLLALSPFDILFASTAFTDPLLTALVLGALLAAAKGRTGMAGVLTGLAAATKQQGLLFLPLFVAVSVLSTLGLPTSPANRRFARLKPKARPLVAWLSSIWGHRWLRFGLGFAVVAAGMIGWDLARQQRPGFFEQGLISYGGLGPAQPGALGERGLEWLRLVSYFWVSPWFNGLLVCSFVAWSIGRLAGRSPHWSRIDLALVSFIVCFLALHWLVGFQVWDRYLLALVPLVALLAARAFVALGTTIPSARWQGIYAAGLGLVLVVTLAGPLWRAARSELPVGGDHGAYDGVDGLAAYMRSQAPPGSVLYHYWLGYHYRFYLYGTPLRLHWYPDLQDLAHDATVYRREPRYIAFPSWRDGAPAQAALAQAGISLIQVFATTRRDGTLSFLLYRLEGP